MNYHSLPILLPIGNEGPGYDAHPFPATTKASDKELGLEVWREKELDERYERPGLDPCVLLIRLSCYPFSLIEPQCRCLAWTSKRCVFEFQ
jgi:hypothetical protein